MAWQWVYKAKVIRVIDGDTIEVMTDRGYGDYKKMRLRLKDIDTPELNSKDQAERVQAMAATAALAQLLPEGKEIVFESFKLSFDRYVADVWLAEDWIVRPHDTIQSAMVKTGHAVIV